MSAETKRAAYAWYVYELAWILPSVALPIGMLGALLVTSFGAGIHLPGLEGRVVPEKLATTPPFDKPGIVQVAPGRYEAHVIGQIWAFMPNELHVPAGSEVTFIATSRDVIHGFYIRGANINMMLIPGQISRQTTRFLKAGEYPLICHEYCGIAHHTMAAKIIVDGAPPKPQLPTVSVDPPTGSGEPHAERRD